MTILDVIFTILKAVFLTVVAIFVVMAFWHGYRIEIGTPESSVYIQLEQYPLKRFFVD